MHQMGAKHGERVVVIRVKDLFDVVFGNSAHH
jgi:hypothetical protein